MKGDALGGRKPALRASWRRPAHQRADPLLPSAAAGQADCGFSPFCPERQAVEAVCTARTIGVTGVEMEALTGVFCRAAHHRRHVQGRG
ncbi:MAG: hypothetical protein ACLVJH_17790 [Faecalibacterium prausnitzii]